ncbi:MAG TPA: LuxR C-terminal-related transcriptional regulator [Casimicrobiaceae bacterium]|nr:LuxR C-terminal-related transcriptional regulator [Casimicrobiaceae bacterium]
MIHARSSHPDKPFDGWPSEWKRVIEAVDADALTMRFHTLASRLGFNGLSGFVLVPSSDGGERLAVVWSTNCGKWIDRYRTNGYMRLDPRLSLTASRLTPLIWDAADVTADWPMQRFLDDAARQRIRSGLAVSFRDATSARIVVSLDSDASPLTDERCAAIAGKLGEFMLLAVLVHERILAPRSLASEPSSRAEGLRLTERERECLRMTASGMTSGAIGGRLGIAERTVNFHMRNVLRKLGALNRAEAIAKALARGMVGAAAPLAQRSA